ncbi:MAG: ABC transporter permease [Candidatus Brockarchaeota archaeon]|nr:ABC transporter permease [Candidatus Brockarchaeota archaeon]
MRLRAIASFVIRDLKLIVRDKSLVFWLIAWPLIWIFMTAYVFVPPAAGEGTVAIKLGVVNLDDSQVPFNGSLIVTIMERVKYNGSNLFNIKPYYSEEEALQALRKGELDAVIVVPDGFGYNVSNIMRETRLKAYIGSRTPQSAQTTSSIITNFFNSFSKELSLKRMESILTIMEQLPIPEEGKQWFNISIRGIMQPLNVTFEKVYPEAFQNRARILGWYTIGAIGMMFLYSGFSSGATLIVSEKERGTLKKLFSTPLTEGEFLIGGFLSQLMMLLISALILMLVGASPVVGACIAFNPFNLTHILALIFIICGALMSMSIGSLISLISKTWSSASNLATVLGILLSFTTGVWFPIEWMPQPVRFLAIIFPPAWSIEASRRILVFETIAETLVLDTTKIFFSTALLLALALLSYRTRIRKYSES